MARRGRRSSRLSNALLGVVALVVVAIISVFAFTKHIPFTHGFILKAQFQSANSIRPNSPVRIAGVDIGKVTSVEPLPGTNAAVLVMDLKKSALPVHQDATAKIRPRIFLEGNFFVDLSPGTPGSPVMHSGDTLKITQTATPVQLDEVLTSLQSDSRQDLKDILDGFDTALNSKPTAAQDATLPPSVRGETASESFNQTLDYLPDAERSTAEVLQALEGTQPGADVPRLISGLANTSAQLDRNESDLQDLITNLNDTMATFAGESDNLKATIHELAPTLASANTAFTALNNAFPPTRAFAIEVLPGVNETAATIDAAFPWVAQMRQLVSKQELGGVAEQLSPATKDLAQLIDRAEDLLPQANLAAKCVKNIVLPTGNVVVHDEFTTGAANYKEFFYALTGIAGEGENTDGNGMYVRFQVGGGTQTVSLGSKSSNSGQLFGNNVEVPLGNRPAYPGKRPPYEPDVPCYTQTPPDLNGPAGGKTLPTGSSASAAKLDSLDNQLLHSSQLATLRAKLHPFATKTGLAQKADK